MNNKTLYAAFAVVLVVAIGAYFFPGSKSVTQFVTGAASPAGSNVTNDFIGVIMNLANPGVNATSSSILNTSSQDRYITFVRGGCENLGTSNTVAAGGGLANLQLTVGTTTTAAPASINAFFTPIIAAYNISTTTTSTAFATSTVLLGANASSIATTSVLWSAGTYLTFTVNATNTANCTFGVDYIGS